MEEPARETGSRPEPIQQHRAATKLLRLLPEVVTVLVGLIALGELLEEFGPNANKMISHIISLLQSFSPSDQRPSPDITLVPCNIFGRETICPQSGPPVPLPSLMDYLGDLSLWLLGIGPALNMLRSGFLGVLMLAAASSLAIAVALSQHKPLYLLIMGPSIALYSLILRYILIGVLAVLGTFLSLLTAFVCMLAGIFVGVKALAAPLEVYHGFRSAGEVGRDLKGK
jgi:hypothetical protein